VFLLSLLNTNNVNLSFNKVTFQWVNPLTSPSPQEPDPAGPVQLLLHAVPAGHRPEEEAQPALGGSGGPRPTRSAARLLTLRAARF